MPNSKESYIGMDYIWLGPYMLAIIVKKGTRYACNYYHHGNLICLQLQRRPNRNGLYTLSISFNRDQICLQCRKSSKNHVTMISGRISRKQIFDDCKHIMSFLKEIASITSPFWIWDCKHRFCKYLHQFVPRLPTSIILFRKLTSFACNLFQ